MQLKINNDIENRVYSTIVTIDSLGTETLSEDEEKELLRDFPSKVCYRTLDFTRKIKITGSFPEITNDEIGDNVVEVTLPALTNKEILLDKDFECVYKIDENKISKTGINDVLNTPELVAQAYCVIFADVIKCEVANIMNKIRTKAPSFTGESLVEV